jgi:ribosomal protein L31E
MGAVVRVTHGPNGLGHALGTVRKMAALANASAHNYAIRQLATRITRNVPSKDSRGELAALYVWVRDNVRYRQDPRGLELVQAPERTLEERAGDCDDIATLLSALAQSLGHRMRYRTVGPTLRDQRHVSTEGECYGEWVSVDPVLEPPRATTAPSSALGAFGQRAPGAAIYYSETGRPMGLHGTASNALWQPTALEQGRSTAPLGPSVYRSAGAAGGNSFGYASLVPIWRNPFDPSDLSGIGAEPRVRDFNTGDVSRDAANHGWASLTAAERRPYKNAIDRWNRIGKDNRVSSRASWMAILNEVPNYTVSQSRAWWGGLSKNQRQARRKKYTKGYGDGLLDVVSSAANTVVDVATLRPIARHIPVVRDVHSAVTNLQKLPLQAATQIARGQRIDRVATAQLKSAVKSARTLAPYVQTVVSVVPGVGQGLSAGIGGAMALAEGRSIDDALIAAVRSAVPGGPLAAAAFDVVVGVAQGKPFEAVALNALPIAPAAKQLLLKGAAAVRAAAEGKPVDQAVLDAALAALPAEARQAAQVAAAVGAAKVIQQGGRVVSHVAQVVQRVPSSAIPAGARPIGRMVASAAKAGPLSAQQVAAQLRARVQPMRRVMTPAEYDALRSIKPLQLQRRLLSGLSLNWSLNGTTDSAAAAVAAVATFIKRNGKPPQIRIAAVSAMQKEIPGLVDDGLWGNNSRAAAAWALSKPVATLPAVAAPWAKKAATWQPPTVATTPAATSPAPAPTKPAPSPAPAATPAPRPTTTTAPAAPKPLPPATSAPAGSKVVTRRQLAQRAIDAVRAFIKKNGKPPAVALGAVRTYQQAAGLGVDGLYGEEVRKFAAVDLGVNASTLPKPHAWKKKASTPTTTKPSSPVVIVAAPTTPSPAPAKPKPTSSSTTKPASSSTPTRRQLAQKAVDAVRAFVSKNGKPPQISIAAVRTYQGKAKLDTDGLWGDDTRNAAAADLGVSASTLPPVAPAFTKKKKKKPATTASSPAPAAPPPPPVVVQTPQGPVVVQPVPEPPQSDWPVPPSSGPFAPPPAPPEPPSNSPPFEPPPAPPEPQRGTSGQGLLIALGLVMLSRRRKRAA